MPSPCADLLSLLPRALVHSYSPNVSFSKGRDVFKSDKFPENVLLTCAFERTFGTGTLPLAGALGVTREGDLWVVSSM